MKHIGNNENISPQPSAEAIRARNRKIAVGVVLALVVVVCICILVFAFRAPAGAVAKVGDEYLYEEDVAASIEQYRAGNGLTDDDAFAESLEAQGKDVEEFRQNIIDEMALELVLGNRAEELDVAPSEEEVDALIQNAKDAFSFGDDDIWAETLSTFSMTEDDLRDQYRANLTQEAVCEADVPKREASEEETLAYAQQNVAGTTQKHAYRIVFTGDDRAARAQECADKVRELAASDELTLEKFKELAAAYSDEEGAAESGGDYAWTGASMNDEVKDLVAEMEPGDFSGAETVEADDALEIIYCDESYEFPPSSDFAEMPGDVPESLLGEVREAAAESVWNDDCEKYCEETLADMKIIYYPMPDDATYAVEVANG